MLSKGDRVKIKTHRIKVGGVEVVIESFYGTFVKEFIGSDDQTYVDIWGEGQYPGQRTILKKHLVTKEDEEKKPEYDGEYYIVRCCDCGGQRKVKPQHLGQVLRCKKCQRAHNLEAAKQRAKRSRNK